MENNNVKTNKKKRFYKVGETVWSITDKSEAKVLKIDNANLEVELDVNGATKVVKLWEIDKLKYKALDSKKKKKVKRLPTIYFAKVRESAIIPSKRDEDAGYDIYANLEPKIVDGEEVFELLLPTNKTTLVPTGIAMALPKTHYFNTKHERGSTGKISMSVLSGVIDSGYRGELFIAITPLNKDILITNKVTETEEYANGYLYPYSKAICQGTIELVPQVDIQEISFEELQNIKSERGATKLGQSGK